MRRRRPLLIGVMALAMLGPAAGANAAVEKSLWGPDKFPAGHPDCPTSAACSAFPIYKQLGVDVYQFQLVWDRIALTRPQNARDPNDPAYKWSSATDSMVQQAAANGIQLGTLVKGTPAWANGGQSTAVAPNDPKDYANFLVAASQRYPTIRRWMIWGEPNYGDNFQPMPLDSPVGPRRYAEILDAAYVGLKEASKDNIVIGGMTVNSRRNVTPPDFIRWMRLGKGKRSRPPRVDLWGHNPFEARFPNIANGPIGEFRGLNDVDTLRKELKRAYLGKKKGKKRKKKVNRKAAQQAAKKKGKRKKKRKKRAPRLWLSEWTVLSDHPSDLFLGFYVSRQQQADYLSAAYAMVNRLPYVQGLGWYRLDDAPASPNNATWGLMTYEGEHKPSFSAFQSVP